MFEHRTQPVLSRRRWRLRVASSVAVAGMVIAVSLGMGTLGYRLFGHLDWIDALLNAAMILTGMGPVDRLDSDGGKLFATFYAIFSGVVFLGITGILVAPWAHRLLHFFHADSDDRRR